MVFIWRLWCATEDIPEDMAVNTAVLAGNDTFFTKNIP